MEGRDCGDLRLPGATVVTTTRRNLSTPVVRSHTMATRRTARGHHGFALADIANDAAGGHTAQRAVVHRNTGGVFTLLYDPRTTARLIEIEVVASWRGDYVPPDGVTAKLSLRGGAGTVSPASTHVPHGLKGSIPVAPALGSAGRLASLGASTFYLDRDALVTAGLSASDVWRLEIEVSCGATAYCEGIYLREVARFVVDDSQSYGELPQRYLPRAVIDDNLRRIGSTLEAAYDLGRRTYHSTTVALASPLSTTSTVFAALPGALSESSGVPAVWRVRPRRIRGAPRVLACVLYRTSSGGDGALRVTTGAHATPFDVTLPATSGAWSLATGHATLADADTDTMAFTAKVDSGTIDIATLNVVDDPN